MKKISYVLLAISFALGLQSYSDTGNGAYIDYVTKFLREKNNNQKTNNSNKPNNHNSPNKTAGSSFKTTVSGLKYMIKRKGKGAKPEPTDQVTVHYTGRFLDGTIFDSSLQRGEPATFRLNQVMEGWTEGLQLMREGALYTFIIPSDLAYGKNGVPGTIPPNADLVFDIELIKTGK